MSLTFGGTSYINVTRTPEATQSNHFQKSKIRAQPFGGYPRKSNICHQLVWTGGRIYLEEFFPGLKQNTEPRLRRGKWGGYFSKCWEVQIAWAYGRESATPWMFSASFCASINACTPLHKQNKMLAGEAHGHKLLLCQEELRLELGFFSGEWTPGWNHF